MKNQTRSHLYAFLTVLLWATAYIGSKVASGSFTPGAMGFLRSLSAATVLAGVILVRRLPPPRMRDWPTFCLSALCGIALYLILFNKGFATIGATTSCVIVAASPVISAVLAAIVFGEKLPLSGWTAIGMAFCGILVMALWEGTMNINVGVVWTAIASFIFAVYNLLQRKLSLSHNSPTVTAYTFIAGTLLLSPFLGDALREVPAAPEAHTLILVLLGVFPSAIAYLLWVKAMSLTSKTSYVTNYMFLTPFLSLLLELAVLRQWPDAGALLGGVIILGSLALFAFAGKRG